MYVSWVFASSEASRPGGGSAGTENVWVPGSTPFGTYFLIACADDTQAVKEGNELNNCLASITRITVGP